MNTLTSEEKLAYCTCGHKASTHDVFDDGYRGSCRADDECVCARYIPDYRPESAEQYP